MSNITTYLKVNKADAHCKDSVTLTSGMAGAKIKFEFSSEWDGLGKTAVFTAGTVTKYVVLDETNICTIPAECLVTPRILIVCGVYGTDGDAVIIPTVWASLGVIVEGTSVSGEEPEAITPTLYNQVTAILNATTDELATVKETKVIEARATVDAVIGTPSVSVSYEWIDEDDHSQGKRLILAFSGLKGKQGDPGNPGYTPRKNIDYFDGDDGFSPAVSSEPIPNGHRVDITDATHTESFNVMNGDDGISPTVTVETTETGSKIIITDRDGAKEIEILNGVDGEDGYTPQKGVDYFDGDDGFSPVVSTSTISGGNRVSITDKTHTENFDILNGVDGTDGTDGVDGVSPSISTSVISGGHKVTITDATHTEEFDVMNGQGSGDMMSSVYDPAGGAKQVAFADELPIPDWNENDPTSPNYIANRTHYSEFADATATASGSGSKEGNLYVTEVYIPNDSSEPIPNTIASAVVTVDGITTEYTNLTLSTYYMGTKSYIANMTMEEWQQQFETGVITNPIIIVFAEEKDYDEELMHFFGYFYVSETAFDSITVTVNYKSGTYHTISPNYLPKATDNELGIINDAPPIDEDYEDEDNIYVRAGNKWISLYEAGVMRKSVYDRWERETDIFDYADKKMEYCILDFDGTKFTHNGTTLAFTRIKNLCLDGTSFVYAQYNNRLYIPQYVSNNNIFFQATYIDSDVPQIHRISINNSNQVSQYSYNLAKDTDVPTIPVTDVQVNGTSIVNNNVANIPLCDNNVKGLCWTYGGDYGIGSTNGLLSLSKAQDGNITNRNNDYRPIVSRNLNFAVKSALTDANHITLTDDEKATVQSVLGIETIPLSKISGVTTEDWVFTPSEGDPFTKKVVVFNE